MKDNVRHVIKTIEHVKRTQEKSAFIFWDAEKAFDNVSTCFLNNVLQKMDCGEEFQKCLQLIYANQSAQILINGMLTKEKIKICKGTRQGCPLSPLLSNVILELANRIREDHSIIGLKDESGEEPKIRSYAYYVVLTLGDPTTSAPRLMNCLSEFGEVAGYKMNRKKTKIFFQGLDQEEVLPLAGKTNCEINPEKIKYLGGFLDRNLKHLFKNN